MLQLNKRRRSILLVAASVGLLFPIWIAVGWGSQIPGAYGIISVAFGSSVFFLALWMANQAKVRGLVTGISIFGGILSGMILLFSVDSLIHYSYYTQDTKLVVVIMCLDIVIYLVLRRCWRKRQGLRVNR